MEAGFLPLRVLDVAREADAAVVVTLAPEAADRARFSFKPGQHLTLRREIGGEDVRRTYSLCVGPDEGVLRVAIKRVEGGVFSHWAAATLAPGDVLEAMPPRGSFTVEFVPGRRRTYVAFAAGSGITPILSLLKAGLATEADSQFVLLYGNRTSSSIMFLEELAALKDRHLGRLQVYHFLGAEADDVELFGGRLDAERIAAVLERLIDPALIDQALICGPGGMMEVAEQALVEAGVDPGAILIERFSAGGPRAAQSQARATARVEITVAIDGRRRRVAFDPALGNILDSARAAGLPAPFACKAGVCATCRAKLMAGEVTMAANYGLSAAEVAAGYVLTCQATPVGDGVAVDYDG